VVDDHALFTDAILPLLRGMEMEVLDVVRSGEKAIRVARRERPDLVMVDLGLPDIDGIAVARRILEELPEARLVALTGRSDVDAVRQARAAGFHAYLTKDIPLQHFSEALSAALRGETLAFPHPAQPRRIVATEDRNAALLAGQLTPRELEVLKLLVEGSDNSTIARRLSVSGNTVRTHVQSILTKLGVRSRLQAAAFAVRHGVVSPTGERARQSSGR
jgi:two-component system, NarL family, nitrate/nitrite response regulator NarL